MSRRICCVCHGDPGPHFRHVNNKFTSYLLPTLCDKVGVELDNFADWTTRDQRVMCRWCYKRVIFDYKKREIKEGRKNSLKQNAKKGRRATEEKSDSINTAFSSNENTDSASHSQVQTQVQVALPEIHTVLAIYSPLISEQIDTNSTSVRSEIENQSADCENKPACDLTMESEIKDEVKPETPGSDINDSEMMREVTRYATRVSCDGDNSINTTEDSSSALPGCKEEKTKKNGESDSKDNSEIKLHSGDILAPLTIVEPSASDTDQERHLDTKPHPPKESVTTPSTDESTTTLTNGATASPAETDQGQIVPPAVPPLVNVITDAELMTSTMTSSQPLLGQPQVLMPTPPIVLPTPEPPPVSSLPKSNYPKNIESDHPLMKTSFRVVSSSEINKGVPIGKITSPAAVSNEKVAPLQKTAFKVLPASAIRNGVPIQKIIFPQSNTGRYKTRRAHGGSGTSPTVRQMIVNNITPEDLFPKVPPAPPPPCKTLPIPRLRPAGSGVKQSVNHSGRGSNILGFPLNISRLTLTAAQAAPTIRILGPVGSQTVTSLMSSTNAKAMLNNLATSTPATPTFRILGPLPNGTGNQTALPLSCLFPSTNPQLNAQSLVNNSGITNSHISAQTIQTLLPQLTALSQENSSASPSQTVVSNVVPGTVANTVLSVNGRTFSTLNLPNSTSKTICSPVIELSSSSNSNSPVMPVMSQTLENRVLPVNTIHETSSNIQTMASSNLPTVNLSSAKSADGAIAPLRTSWSVIATDQDQNATLSKDQSVDNPQNAHWIAKDTRNIASSRNSGTVRRVSGSKTNTQNPLRPIRPKPGIHSPSTIPLLQSNRDNVPSDKSSGDSPIDSPRAESSCEETIEVVCLGEEPGRLIQTMSSVSQSGETGNSQANGENIEQNTGRAKDSSLMETNGSIRNQSDSDDDIICLGEALSPASVARRAVRELSPASEARRAVRELMQERENAVSESGNTIDLTQMDDSCDDPSKSNSGNKQNVYKMVQCLLKQGIISLVPQNQDSDAINDTSQSGARNNLPNAASRTPSVRRFKIIHRETGEPFAEIYGNTSDSGYQIVSPTEERGLRQNTAADVSPDSGLQTLPSTPTKAKSAANHSMISDLASSPVCHIDSGLSDINIAVGNRPESSDNPNSCSEPPSKRARNELEPEQIESPIEIIDDDDDDEGHLDDLLGHLYAVNNRTSVSSVSSSNAQLSQIPLEIQPSEQSPKTAELQQIEQPRPKNYNQEPHDCDSAFDHINDCDLSNDINTIPLSSLNSVNEEEHTDDQSVSLLDDFSTASLDFDDFPPLESQHAQPGELSVELRNGSVCLMESQTEECLNFKKEEKDDYILL